MKTGNSHAPWRVCSRLLFGLPAVGFHNTESIRYEARRRRQFHLMERSSNATGAADRTTRESLAGGMYAEKGQLIYELIIRRGLSCYVHPQPVECMYSGRRFKFS